MPISQFGDKPKGDFFGRGGRESLCCNLSTVHKKRLESLQCFLAIVPSEHVQSAFAASGVEEKVERATITAMCLKTKRRQHRKGRTARMFPLAAKRCPYVIPTLQEMQKVRRQAVGKGDSCHSKDRTLKPAVVFNSTLK